MLRKLWPFFFPLLFLPDLAGNANTQFGVVEMSDWLIVPYIILLWSAADMKVRNLFDRAVPLILTFLVWAFISTITINLRYNYPDYHETLFSLLKFAKFILYGFAGYLTTKCLANVRERRRFAAAIVAAGLVLGTGAFFFGSKSRQLAAVGAGVDIVSYKAANAISVYAAMMACYLASLWSRRITMSALTRKFTLLSMIALVLGSALTEGRGGWIAGIVGFFFILWRGGLKRQVAALLVVVPLFVVASYYAFPTFQKHVDLTVNPANSEYTTAGIDNGARLAEWRDGLSQFPADPFFGTGFFHRGGNTAIYATGSHNFFLQIFLETGFPGGILMILIFLTLWKQAGTSAARSVAIELPAKASLVAAVAGGMGGEYFYGGIGLLTLLSLYALCGSLPQRLPAAEPVAANQFESMRVARTAYR